MVFTIQDGANLRDQVTTLMQQLATLMRQNEAITGAFGFIRSLATQEIGQLPTQLAAGGGAAADFGDFKPDSFSGKRAQDCKPCCKSFFTLCNMQCPGFRAAGW